VARRRVGAILTLIAGLSCFFGCGTPTDPAERAAIERGVAPLIQRGDVARETGNYDLAISSYREALERTPWNTRFARLLAVSYAERAAKHRETPGPEGLRAAESDLRRALDIDSEDLTFKRNLAVVLVERARIEVDEERARAFREQAEALDPLIVASSPAVSLSVERRLDLAYDLLQRGQIDVGVRRLEALHAEHPGRVDVTRLLAQALVRRGQQAADRRDYPSARGALDRAVAMYDELEPCDGERCDAAELRGAHYNRLVVLIESNEIDAARVARDAASRLGLTFPALNRELDR
jgi:tetratricopeptide (TPR) repeat protein